MPLLHNHWSNFSSCRASLPSFSLAIILAHRYLSRCQLGLQAFRQVPHISSKVLWVGIKEFWVGLKRKCRAAMSLCDIVFEVQRMPVSWPRLQNQLIIHFLSCWGHFVLTWWDHVRSRYSSNQSGQVASFHTWLATRISLQFAKAAPLSWRLSAWYSHLFNLASFAIPKRPSEAIPGGLDGFLHAQWFDTQNSDRPHLLEVYRQAKCRNRPSTT